jgi:hypothetical protein
MENLSASGFQEVEVGAHRWWGRNKGNLKIEILKKGSKSVKLGFISQPSSKSTQPLISGITAHATMPGRLEHFIISFCSRLLIQMNGGRV